MRWAPATLAIGLLGACEEPVSRAELGLGLKVRVAEAQLMRGALRPDEGGPEVTQVMRPQPEVMRGEGTVALGGRLGAGGIALHVHADGDPDHWLVTPRGFDFVVADELLWDATLQFSHALEDDALALRLQAVDKQGRAGPVTATEFALLPDLPPALLLVSLGWDAPADLDLHVELPDGTIVGAKNINAFEPAPGQPPPADGASLGGFHDYDSNQQCRLDLRNRENVVWTIDPPAGRYRVYAQLFSPCDAPVANFEVVVQQGTEVAQSVGGSLYPFDARVHPAPGEAPGLFVLEFEVP